MPQALHNVVFVESWHSGPPGSQAPISKVPVEAVAAVASFAFRCLLQPPVTFRKALGFRFWSRWHAQGLKGGLRPSPSVVRLLILREGSGLAILWMPCSAHLPAGNVYHRLPSSPLAPFDF